MRECVCFGLPGCQPCLILSHLYVLFTLSIQLADKIVTDRTALLEIMEQILAQKVNDESI